MYLNTDQLIQQILFYEDKCKKSSYALLVSYIYVLHKYPNKHPKKATHKQKNGTWIYTIHSAMRWMLKSSSASFGFIYLCPTYIPKQTPQKAMYNQKNSSWIYTIHSAIRWMLKSNSASFRCRSHSPSYIPKHAPQKSVAQYMPGKKKAPCSILGTPLFGTCRIVSFDMCRFFFI